MYYENQTLAPLNPLERINPLVWCTDNKILSLKFDLVHDEGSELVAHCTFNDLPAVYLQGLSVPPAEALIQI